MTTEKKQTATPPQEETSIDRFEHEIEELEGVTGRKRWAWWVGGILVVGGMAAALILVRAPEQAPGASAVKGLLQLDLQQPRPGKLAAAPTQFRWESVSGRSSYLFRLNAMGGPTALVERSAKENSLDLTAEEVARLVKGKSYVWQVEAVNKQGNKLAAGQSFFDL